VRQLERERRRLQRARAALLGVQQASAAVASRLDVAEVLQQIVNQALRVVNGDAATLYIAVGGGRLEPQAVAGDADAARMRSYPSVTTAFPAYEEIHAQGGLIIGDALTDPRFAPARAEIRANRVKSLVCVPLEARGKRLGVLAIVSRRRRSAFRREDLDIIRLFAEQAALVLSNSRLYAETKTLAARMAGDVELVKAVCDGARDAVALINSQDRVVYANPALVAVLGRKPQAIIGRRWQDFLDRESAEGVIARVEAAEGKAVRCEVRVKQPDGGTIPLIVTTGDSRDGSGRVIGSVAMLTEVEEDGRLLGRGRGMLVAMRSFTRAVSRTTDATRLAQHALRCAADSVGVASGVLHLLQGDTLALVASQGLPDDFLAVAQRVPVQGSIAGRALASRKPLIFRDVRRSRWLSPAFRAVVPPDQINVMFMPIPGREAAIGTLTLSSPDPSPFSHEAVGALSILAAQFGAAIENARLCQATRARAERLAMLNRAVEDLLACNRPDEVVPVACRAMAQVLNVRRVLGIDYAADKQMLIPIAGFNVSSSRVRRLRNLRLAEAPLLAAAINERQPVLSEDAARDHSLPEDYCRLLRLRAVIAVPVISRKELLGVELADNEGEAISLTPEEKDMAMALANETALAVDNILLLRDEQLRSQQLSVAVQEAHHRIKNNLQAVCDLLELEQLESGGQPDEAIARSIQRVHAISLVHEFLSRHHDVATVDVSRVLERLVPLVVTSNQRLDQRVAVSVKAAPINLSSRITTALALIVNELVSNAVRHGLNHGHGAVEVGLCERNGSVYLRVADNGIGLPPGFDARRSSHVGLEIARVLAERDLAGTIVIANRGGRRRGAVAQVRFPR
jgi:PAS domain S-box-containing protein